ncbi:MAG: YihY/virulence factor BrkB family protein [Bacteroidales bacterium]|nr:YihY/virulence factor BrkB family protein [Bacteroidales bacterium]
MEKKNKFISFIRKLILPGFKGIPLYDVIVFFIKGLGKGFITSRAAAISFSEFLAVFPAIIFIFTLIPYIPINNFQNSLLELIKNFTPAETYNVVRDTIEDIIQRPRGGLLSVGFILTLYFSTNGVNSIIEAFNNTSHTIETRSSVKQYLVALLLVLIISILVILAIALISLGDYLIKLLILYKIIPGGLTYYLLLFSKWIVIIALFFFAVSFLYYFAPAKKNKFNFISPGSSLSTILFILTTLGFNWYLSHFSQYNKLYGSIGTVMVIMLWFYLSSIILLIGFELNASIAGLKKIKY